jgi:hypothetical protein
MRKKIVMRFNMQKNVLKKQMKKCQNLQGVLFCNVRTRENMLDIFWQNI